MKVIKRCYYIKVNGKIYEVSQDTFKEFKKNLKESKSTYLCPTCKVSNCNKITYSNIKYCPEVNDATYIYEVHERTNSVGVKFRTNYMAEFEVFDCKQYKMLSDLLKKNNDSKSIKYSEEELEKIKEERKQLEAELMLKKILEMNKK